MTNLREKGISFLQSNSDCPEIRELYSDYKIKTVQAKRNINSNARERGEINEVNILKSNKINILPVTRSSYVMSDFILYKEIPELNESVTQMAQVDIPKYESINVNNINSENNAINVMVISGILNDFLDTDENILTFNGRMGTGIFDFTVNSYSNVSRKVHV